MRIYVIDYPRHAGHWIYKGYQKAWHALGYDVYPVNKIEEIEAIHEQRDSNEEYMVMFVDADPQPEEIGLIERSKKAFIFAQPNQFPSPWGHHPNFRCLASDGLVDVLNQMDHVRLWTFGDDVSRHVKWKEVHTVPLAFDHIGYQPAKDDNYKQYDICFIGGWANNGFNEKRPIMIEIFSEFMKTDLKCGFFVEKNLTHEQECALLYNSRLTLNIHDAYQRILGNDTNERTFKSLGLNGILVSDTVGQLNRLFPDLPTSLDAKGLVEITQNYLSLTEQELTDIREKNRQDILENHCYTNRVQQLLEL